MGRLRLSGVKRPYRGWFLVVILASLVSPAVGQPPAHLPAKPLDGVIAHVRDTLQHWMAQHHIPGVAIAVEDASGLRWSEALGRANVETNIPLTQQTLMRVASLSKPMTSVAVGLLYEQGHLDLDWPVQFYLPFFPSKRWYFSTRQLAGHLAGIRHYQGDEFYNTRSYRTVRDALDAFQYWPLLHKPGHQYLYSSYGWNLISAVIEARSGKAFLDYMQHHVFDPLGMKQTVAEHKAGQRSSRSRQYQWRNGVLVEAPYVDNSIKWAAGGYLSTALDLVKLGRSMLHATLLRPSTINLLFTPQFTAHGEPTNYGMGWAVRDQNGRRYIGHTGGAVGGSSVLVLTREAGGIVVALICNLEGVTMHPMGMYILDQFAEIRLTADE